jgi:hypothetical protein
MISKIRLLDLRHKLSRALGQATRQLTDASGRLSTILRRLGGSL